VLVDIHAFAVGSSQFFQTFYAIMFRI